MRAKLAGAVLVVVLCFAANSVMTRLLVSRQLLDAASTTVARFVSGALMLALVLAWQDRSREAVPDLRRDWALVAALGGYALAIAYGYRHISAAAGTFVFYALVVATMTAGGPRPSVRAAAGAAIALAGVGLLAIGRVEGTTTLGVALLALTGAAWGAYSLLLRRRAEPLATNAKAFLAFAALSPLLLVVDHGGLVFTWTGLAMGVFMGAITTALVYALWARVLPELSPIQAGTVQLAVPVVTALAGVVLLREPFGPRLAVAGLLVLGGMWLASGKAARRQEPQ